MEAFASSASPLEQPADIDLTVPETSRPNSSHAKMPNDSNIGSSADKPIELDLDSMDIDMAMTDLFGDSDNNSTEATNTVDGLFSPVVGDTVMANDFPGKPEKTEENFLHALNQPNNDIFATLGHPDHSEPSKPSLSAAHPAPSPESLLASLSSSSQLVAHASTSNDASGEPQFDLNSLDLSTLGSGFFTNASEHDMNFPMDMSDFLNLGATHEHKGDDGEVKQEPT